MNCVEITRQTAVNLYCAKCLMDSERNKNVIVIGGWCQHRTDKPCLAPSVIKTYVGPQLQLDITNKMVVTVWSARLVCVPIFYRNCAPVIMT